MLRCKGIFTVPVRLSAIHISPSGAMISVALETSRNASPSGAVMWKLRDHIVAPLGLKNMMPIYRYYRPAGAGFRESMVDREYHILLCCLLCNAAIVIVLRIYLVQKAYAHSFVHSPIDLLEAWFFQY